MILRAFAVLAVLAGIAHAEEPLFPFVVPYDSPANLTNVASWLEQPAGGHGFVHEKGGHLATDAGPIRFWATNLCFEACFGPHEMSDRIAARLARLGINCVRLHHMDARAIWGKSPNKLTIDLEKLERLDYLIAQLKRHGVYVNINLHVSRWFDTAEGFPAREQRPNYDKGLDNFEPRMIALQKKYARDLLTHVNPYTNTAYVDEPAVAFVEINNENAIFSEFSGGHLDDLPEPYATTYRKLWNQWLHKKYGTNQRLEKAWNVGRQPLGAEQLANGDFARPYGKPWSLEIDSPQDVEVSVQPAGPEGRPCLRLNTKKAQKIAWRPQLIQTGLAVKRDMPYTFTCWMRAATDRMVGVNTKMAHAPWQDVGLTATCKVTTQWKQHRFTFTASQDEPQARISFSQLGQGPFELAAVSLRPGGIIGLEPGESLDNDTVPVVRRRGTSATQTARSDFIDFLWETERDYWSGMHRFLKDELKVRSLVAGTQLGYSPVYVQAALDFLDNHSYWQHPHFPGRPWDMRNWTVRNTALVNSAGGTLSHLAAARVAGRAYTVSEYNHPQPNQYAAEGFPMIAAFGALQGWDGIYSFAYCHNEQCEPRRIDSFFDIKGDTAKLVHMPACVALFLRGDVTAARKLLTASISQAEERKVLAQVQSARTLSTDEFGLDSRQSLIHRIALALDEKSPRLQPVARDVKPAARYVSDTGQLCWDLAKDKAGFFTVDTPRTKLFTGFVAGRTFELGNVKLTIGPTRLDWATVSMVCIDGPGFDQPGRILIAATGLEQNTNARLETVSDDKVTLGNRWGEEPLLCEGVPAQIALPLAAGRLKCYPLDESGNRRPAINVTNSEGRAQIILSPQHKTLWYEVEIGK